MAPRQKWAPEEWQAALYDGEQRRQADRFAKEAAEARRRSLKDATPQALSERFAAEFAAATEQRKQGVSQASILARRPRTSNGHDTRAA